MKTIKICPECGKKLERLSNWNPSTKQVEGFRFAHTYSLEEVMSGKKLCFYIVQEMK